MAKIKTYQPVVDYTSQISVSAHSGISKAAQAERQIAENWSALGTDLTTMITDELKLRNVENANELASQISYDKKPVDVEINGQTETVDMTHVIQPEGKIVGESGMLAYKKILATNWISQLDNDLTQITETQANESEDMFETMEMFAAKTLQKHEAIYEQLPDTVSSLLRADAEKHIITRGARVQNVFLAEKNRRDNELWNNQHSDLTEKIWNKAERGEDVTHLLGQYEELYINGIELKNIKQATTANQKKALEDMAGVVSFFKITNTLTTKDFSDPRTISADLKNTRAIINLLNPIPGQDSYEVYDMINQSTTKLTKKQVHDTLQDEQLRTDMLSHFKRRLTYLKELEEGHNAALEGMSRALNHNRVRDVGALPQKLTGKDLDELIKYSMSDWVKRYNKVYGRNIDVANAKQIPHFQSWLASDRAILLPELKAAIETNFKNFQPDIMKQMYDTGILSRLKNFYYKGTDENLLIYHFGPELGDALSMFTDIADTKIISINDLGDMYAEIRNKRISGGAISDKEAAAKLGFISDKEGDPKKLHEYIKNIYDVMTPGAPEARANARFRVILDKVKSNALTETLITNIDIKDYIYDQERIVKNKMVKDSYIHNPDNKNGRDSIDRESWIGMDRSSQKYMLAGFNRETKTWEIGGDWNLDYLIPWINNMIANDTTRGMGHYTKFWTSDKPGVFSTLKQGRTSVQEFVDSEFRAMGRIKLIPAGYVQEFPQYYVGKVNDDGSVDYILQSDGQRAVLDIAKIYVPAHRNMIKTTPGLKDFLIKNKILDTDGRPTKDNVELGTFKNWVDREILQFKHGLSDWIPDPWQTTEETLWAGGIAATSPAWTATVDATWDAIKHGAGWVASKTGIKFNPKTAAKEKYTKAFERLSKAKGRMGLLAAIGVTLWSFGSANSRDITNYLDGNNLWENDHDLPYLGYYREPGMYDLPEFIIDAYDPAIPEYVHTEEYVNEDVIIPKGTKSTVMLSAEQHPDLGWMVFPNVVVINGERVLLNKEDAMQHAINKGENIGYIPFDDSKKAIEMSRDFSNTVQFWRTNPHANWWLDGINPGTSNE